MPGLRSLPSSKSSPKDCTCTAQVHDTRHDTSANLQHPSAHCMALASLLLVSLLLHLPVLPLPCFEWPSYLTRCPMRVLRNLKLPLLFLPTVPWNTGTLELPLARC